MNAKDVVLFVFDEPDHFQSHLEQLGKDSFKNTPTRIDSLENFEKELSVISQNEPIHLVVHIFYENLSGIKKFLSSGILVKYPLIDVRFISDGTSTRILEALPSIDLKVEEVNFVSERILQYFRVRQTIEDDSVKIHTVQQHLNGNGTNDFEELYNIDYVIITALEQDEMEKVLPLIEKTGTINNGKHLIEVGYFKSKPDKMVVYASQISTGMVDAAILATELICKYSPKFVIMTGVMGGKPEDTMIGDVVISKSVFTIDKGKIADEDFKKEVEWVPTESSYTRKITRERQNIIDFIRDSDQIYNKQINIHFEPIACVRAVIDKKEFFKNEVLTVERKTIGLEMEGYGIARACQIVNEGKTIPLIIKAVMDNTQEKTDEGKKLAAWTSAKTLEYIIANDII